MKFGLRLQLAVILVSAFAVLFFLLGFALVGLEQRARGVSTDSQVESSEPLVTTPEQFALAVRRHQHAAWQRIHSLLFFYAMLTGVVVVLLSYVFLTLWIVQPLEALIHASEALARGHRRVQVRPRGPVEVAHLAGAFNHMAGELQAERDRLEQRLAELEKTTRELRMAQDQVVQSEKLASVGRLSAGIAHEIGNPLAAILGLVELLRGGGLAEHEQSEFLRRIHKETERIHHIIRDLLDFSRQQSPERAPLAASGALGAAAQPPAQSTDLVQIVEEAVRLIAPQKDLRDVTLERRFQEGTPHVQVSAHSLTQIVLNLLLNAADAVGGQGTITVEVRPAHEDDAMVSLIVTDTGSGIAPEIMDRLFEPFATTKPPGQGTGLGLAVCHSLVTAARGTISASNPSSGGGARFEVRLPAAQRASRDEDLLRDGDVSGDLS
jgi:two-component system NtrC family sensor kinase